MRRDSVNVSGKSNKSSKSSKKDRHGMPMYSRHTRNAQIVKDRRKEEKYGKAMMSDYESDT